MKKVFAFLSTLLLTIACVGIFSTSDSASAAGKWTEDPTLAEDEIPVYINGSIMATFPNYYDLEAKADDAYAADSRNFAWNETRLRIAQFGEDGQPTGKYYAVYFVGQSFTGDITQSAAGNMVYVWTAPDANDNGTVEPEEIITGQYNKGKLTKDAAGKEENVSMSSLSYMRYNATGVDIEWQTVTGSTLQVDSVIFNAKGQPIRGVANAKAYDIDENTNYEFTPEYCFVEGVVTKYDNASQCDVESEPKTNADGKFVDAEGNVVENPEDAAMVDVIQYIDERFVWEFFETEPTNVNPNGYLNEGWDPANWDYCYAVDGGYIAIAFCGASDAKALGAVATEVLVERKMAADETLSEETAKKEVALITRDCVSKVRVPAGGYAYVCGYLDKDNNALDVINETVLNGYKYGYKMENMAEVRTYNFSAGGLKYQDKVIDGQSYQLLNGQNVVEVMQGHKFKPSSTINYTGVVQYWSKDGDITSFKADDASAEFYVYVGENGKEPAAEIQPTLYPTFATMRDAYLADYNAWVATKQGYKLNAETGAYEKDGVAWEALHVNDAFSTGGRFYTTGQNYLAAGSANANMFTQDSAMVEKWGWLYEYIKNTMAANGISATNCNYVPVNGGTTASPGTFLSIFYHFLQQGYKSGWPSSQLDWSKPEYSEGWIDLTPTSEKWAAFELDASAKAPGDYWTVVYKVENTATKQSASMTIKYVVVDSYTPLISYDASALRVTPRMEGDNKVIDAINPYALVKAYNAQYNGVDIKGNDITQNVEFETELDWNNPVEGKHEVTATIWNNARTKKASVNFVIEVVDITAPNLKVRPVTLNQGEDFDFRDAIIYAYDAVDGDLTKASYDWYVVDSINTNVPGTYNLKITVYDRTDNASKPASIKVTVNAAQNVQAPVEALGEQVAALDAALEEVKGQVAGLAEENAAMQAALAKLSTDLAAVAGTANGAAKAGAVTTFGIINAVLVAGAVGILVFSVFFKGKKQK